MKTPLRSPFRSHIFVSLAAAFILSCRAVAQITVTTAADENDTPAGAQVSLREALRDSSDGGVITFDEALNGKVLLLSGGEMAVTGKTLTVNAPGGFVIEARKLSRIFNVAPGAGLNLAGLTLQGGLAPADGGAVLNAGTLSLTDCVLRENSASNGPVGTPGPATSPGTPAHPGGPGGPGSGGGAISSLGLGTLTALRCRFVGNAAGAGGNGGPGGPANNTSGSSYPPGVGGTGGTGGAGGAILSAGPLVLTECIFESNLSGAGGIGGTTPSTGGISGNGGAAGNGGAVHQSGNMTVSRCSFVSNICRSGGLSYVSGGRGGSGAAVFWRNGAAAMTNCTVTNNSTGEGGAQTVEFGGAVAAEGGTPLRLVHCTVTGNLAVRFYVSGSALSASWVTSPAAGIVSTAAVQCYNCILSGNLRNVAGFGAAPVWEEANISPGTPRTVIPYSPLGETLGVNAQLGALAITSGQMPVLVPGPASPALNASAIITGAPVTDQRGLPRAVGFPDLGAVEVQPVEVPPRAYQSINSMGTLSFSSASIVLGTSASSELPVSFELVSGPATLTDKTLAFNSPGLVAIRASQPGDAATAPALPVVWVIEAREFIPFTAAESYTVYPQNPAVILLPAATFAGLPVTWSLVGTPGAGATLTGNQFTATKGGVQTIRGQSAGTAQFAPVDSIWSLRFVQGALWWETPPADLGGPYWFTLVEGSPHGLSMTASIAAAHTSAVPVPSLPGGVVAVPSVIPAGQTSVQCYLTLPANPLLTNQTGVVLTGHPSTRNITLFLANRAIIPLDVFAPAVVIAGASTPVDVACPGVPTGLLTGPPPDLGVRTVTVSAVDFDNPAISIPVTLDSATSDAGPYPRKHLKITFPPVNRRARLTVTTDDGISGQAGPVRIYADTNADGDDISDIVEAALQRAPNQFDPPPLTFERDATGVRAVLGSRPLDLKGWSVVIEVSTDLQTWTPASAGSTTVTPNPDGTTERVSVLLPTGAGPHFVRLSAALP